MQENAYVCIIIKYNMKTCTKCKKEKELTQFHKNNRAKDGHQWICKLCSIPIALKANKKNKDKINKRRRERRISDSVFRESLNKKKMQAYWEQREKHFLMNAKQALKRRGLECNLELSDIVIPKECPIFKVPFDKGRYSPSLDRIDNSKGYIKGNVWVISKVANIMKNDASLEELLKFCEEMPKLIKI